MSALLRIRAVLRGLRSDRRANVTITFALALIPIIGFVGAAVDYSRANSAKASMQASLDATALALSKEAVGLSAAALNSKADAYFKANFNRPEAKNIIVTPTFTDLGNGNFKIQVAGTAKIDTTITGIWQPSIAIGANSQVLWGYKKLELALALDNTGSMAVVQQDDASEDRGEEFDRHAEEGREKRRATSRSRSFRSTPPSIWEPATRTSPGSTSTRSIATAGNPAAAATARTGRITGKAACATAPSPMTRRTTPPGTLAGTKFPVHDCGSLTTLVPLTYDWTKLNSKVDAMQPNGNTNVTIGLAWALHSLTPARAVVGGVRAKAGSRQGHHSVDRWREHRGVENSNNTTITNVTTIDARTKVACNNVKAAGIKLYTIRVIDGNADLLSQCATNPTYFYDVQDAASSTRCSRPSHRAWRACVCRSEQAPAVARMRPVTGAGSDSIRRQFSGKFSRN